MVIWIKHDELELDIVCNEWNPFAVLLGVDVDIVLNVDLTFVILWVVKSIWLVTHFIVSHVGGSQDTAFLQVPFDHLSTEDKVW